VYTHACAHYTIHAYIAGAREPGEGVKWPRKFTWGFWPQSFWKQIFSGKQVSRFSAKSLKLLPPAVRF